MFNVEMCYVLRLVRMLYVKFYALLHDVHGTIVMNICKFYEKGWEFISKVLVTYMAENMG